MQFLETVVRTIGQRCKEIPKGFVLYRAQEGIEYIGDHEGEVGISAFGRKRMKPQRNRARENRANPAGIPVLYLSSSKRTAISEIRPWNGSEISVAKFRTVRELKIIDLSEGREEIPENFLMLEQWFADDVPSRETRERAVWTDIENAFSRPVSRSDELADYVPTQILAELFQANGFDALVYRSQFGDSCQNFALFNIDDADPIEALPVRITGLEVKFESMGNRWISKKAERE